MRWIAVAVIVLALAGGARAAGPDDEYLDIYNEILQGDSLQQNSHAAAAAAKYLQAQTALQELKAGHPSWNSDIISFRLDYLAEQLRSLAKFLPPANAPPPAAAAPVPDVVSDHLREQVRALTAANTELENKLKEPPSIQPAAAAPVPDVMADHLREQVRALTAANTELENKLKEALSIQPAAVSPGELAKVDAQNVALQKERDLLAVALAQAKTGASPVADTAARAEVARLKESLAAANRQMEVFKSSHSAKEEGKLRKQLAARTRDMADAQARNDQTLLALQSQLKQAGEQRDELQRKLAVRAPVSSAGAEVEQLRTRLAVLEAKAAPYTPEELAVLNKDAAPPPVAAPAEPAEHKHPIHTNKDLPPGAGALMADATRATMERDFAGAAAKYEQILREDENNVYVLASLAKAQMSLNQMAECEKTVRRALALDPEDPSSLYLLGILQYQQHKLDDALDTFSRSVSFNPTNAGALYAGTHYYLGRVLKEKGLLPAAETALRKSLAAEPDSPDAHYSLAFIYAVEKPPSLELARWHYKRALDLRYPKSPEMEKLLAPSQ